MSLERPATSAVLTPQQRRVLRLVAVGCSDKVIAGRMGISERTVRFHVASAANRLNARTRAHMVGMAIQRGEIGRPPYGRRQD